MTLADLEKVFPV